MMKLVKSPFLLVTSPFLLVKSPIPVFRISSFWCLELPVKLTSICESSRRRLMIGSRAQVEFPGDVSFMEWSINGGTPNSWMVYFMENPTKMDDDVTKCRGKWTFWIILRKLRAASENGMVLSTIKLVSPRVDQFWRVGLLGLGLY